MYIKRITLLFCLLIVPVIPVFGTVITGNAVVTAPAFNHALGGTAMQSSTLVNPSLPTAAKAIDGITDGIFNNSSVTHTTGGELGFWEVDLGAPQNVDFVQLYNRTDCCGLRLSNFEISVSNTSGGPASWSQSYHTGGTTSVGANEVFGTAANTVGQFVRVGLLGNNNDNNQILSLAEVQVFEGIRNLARSGVANQSTLASGGVASRGNDGGLNSNYTAGATTTHTDTGSQNNFWEVQLDGSYTIQEIALYNRGDCCGTRLSNFRVSAFDGAAEVFGQNFFEGTGSVAQGGIFSLTDDAGPIALMADRVRIELLGFNNDGTGVLSLTEVEVYGMPVVIPEPSSLALLLLGLGLVGAHRLRK